ncbi:patatin-like phospholipase domain-containing protein 2 [Anguilla rostrata]|uniref:patatin-like phospholipase domain-containing protein 2 n=1 Tax=Anguilla rostrata TaxID=7938 RepID=UPI0030CB6043
MSPKSGTAALAGKAPLSMSFLGSGFLAVYQLGVVQCLLDVAPGVVEGAPEVFGASAGSLAAAAVVCGTNMGHARDEMIKFAQGLRRRAGGPLHPSADVFRGIERVLRRLIPENAHLRAGGRLHVAVMRVPDGKAVLISRFQSREDLIQALLCSCFLPLYCGLTPPRFKGDYYMDGGFTSIQPVHNRHRILSVSPFAGDVDICPRDPPQSHYDLVVSGLAFQMTTPNFHRMIDALFPPAGSVLQKAYASGYQDAHFFLQRSDLIEYQPSVMNGLAPSSKACSGRVVESHMLQEEEETEREEKEEENNGVEEEEEEEEREVPTAVPQKKAGISGCCSPSPESSGWSLSSLEQALYLSLPGWVQTALLCNLMAQIGLLGFHDTFQAHLISYLLLPYTLPACIFFHFTCRLLLWLRRVPEDVFWLWQDTKQIVLFFIRTTVSSLKKNLEDRYLPPVRLTPVLEFLSEGEVSPKMARVRRRSTLRVQLSGVGSSESRSRPCPEALGFSFQLDLGVEVDSQPDVPALPPCQQPPPLGSPPSSEGEDEPAPTLSTSQVSPGGGGEGEGETSILQLSKDYMEQQIT